MLNRQKNMQLIQMYKKFKDLLIECKQNILEKNEIVKQHYAAFKTQRQSSGSWRVCAPYFKDKGFYVSPPNSDTIKKKNNKELSCYDLMPLKKWTQYECNRLIGAVKLNYNANVVFQLKKTVRLAKVDEMTEEQKEELKAMKLKLNKLSNAMNFEIPPLGSDENINWIRVAEIFIRGNRCLNFAYHKNAVVVKYFFNNIIFSLLQIFIRGKRYCFNFANN